MDYYIITYLIITVIISNIGIYFKLRDKRGTMRSHGIRTLLYIFITGPFIEELVFRGGIVALFDGVPYKLEIVTTLFILVHLLNFYIMGWWQTIFQTIAIIYPSYYIFIKMEQMHMIWYILLHITFNIVNSLYTIYDFIFNVEDTIIEKIDSKMYVSYNKLRKSKSMSDIRENKSIYDLYCGKSFTIPDEYVESFKKFRDKCNNFYFPCSHGH